MTPSQSEVGPVELASPHWFATTHWSVVLAAKQDDSSGAAIALEKLCRTYWPPLYAYIRRDGRDLTEAQDLTQEFFARLLARDYLQHLHHQQGKFRSFLLAYLKNFLSEQRRKAGAQKRGGGCVFISLNEPAGEDGYLLDPVDELKPDQVFERRWAQTVTIGQPDSGTLSGGGYTLAGGFLGIVSAVQSPGACSGRSPRPVSSSTKVSPSPAHGRRFPFLT